MADASDSKSDEGDLVWVQVPSPASYPCKCCICGVYKGYFFASYCPLLLVLSSGKTQKVGKGHSD